MRTTRPSPGQVRTLFDQTVRTVRSDVEKQQVMRWRIGTARGEPQRHDLRRPTATEAGRPRGLEFESNS